MSALRTFWRTVVRGRCPACGQTAMFAGFYTLHERCAVCDTRYESSSGDWLGGTAIGYAIGAAAALVLGVAEILWSPIRRAGLPPTWTIAATSLVVTAIGYHWAKAIWYALLYEGGFMARGDAPPGPPPLDADR